MRFVSFVVKNLTRRPLRTGLTFVALATAITAVVALLGVAKGFVAAFRDVYESHAVDLVVSRQGSADRLSSSVDESFVDRIKAVSRVSRAAGVLLDSLSLEDRGVYGVPTMGIAADSWLLDDFRMESGSGSLGRGDRVLMLGTHLADRVGVVAGDRVRLFEEAYEVVGVFESRSAWENGSMVLPLGRLQSLTGRVGQVTYINVVLEPGVGGDRADAVIGEIESIDPKLLAMTTRRYVATDTRMRIASAMAWMTSTIALMIGAIGVLNTMMTSVLERTSEIGILRAIGWPRRRVVRMVLMETLGLSLVASAAGIAAALVLTWLLSRASAVRGVLTPSVDGDVIARGVSLAVIIGLCGAILPAWRAARMLPTEAFRQR